MSQGPLSESPSSSKRRRAALSPVHPDAAGIDVHSEFHFVAVPEGRDPQPVRRFGAFTELHTFGLLAAAFRPDDNTCVLRAYLRQRAMLIEHAAQHIQHMQKAMTQMNVKLKKVLSDITGVTGLRIIDAILSGERDPQTLAKLRDERCHHDEAITAPRQTQDVARTEF